MSVLCRRLNLLATLALMAGSAAASGSQDASPAPPPAPTNPPVTEPAPPPAANPAPRPPPPEPVEAVVALRDGRRIIGILVSQDKDKVVLRVGGIDTDFPRATIEKFQVLPPLLERYADMREAEIDPADMQQMLRFAEWLRSRDRFDLALAEIDRALSVTPGNAEGTRARALILAQMELAAKAGKPRPAGQPGAGGEDPAAPPVRPDRRPFPVLTPEQINLIKVYEVDLSDPPNLLIKREAITRLMTDHAGNPLIPATAEGRESMYRQSPASILDTMFRLQARDLYGQVQVIGHPRSMRLFRDDVHRTWLVNACATARCHGGAEAGRLQLAMARPGSEETVYTNFLILDRYRTPSGVGLINYEEPVRSPLLHMGLPRKDSLYPHPAVPGPHGRGDLWRPVFQSTREARYEQAMAWIRAMYRPRPEYPVQFTPPQPLELPAAAEAAPPGPGR